MIETNPQLKEIKLYNPPIEGRGQYIRLDFNENVVGCSPRVLKAIQSIQLEEIAMYPEYTEIYKKLTEVYNVQKDEVLLVSGLDEGLRIICETYLNRNERVIIPQPSFTMYNYYSSIVGAQKVPLQLNDDFSYPIDKLLTLLQEHFKVIFLCTPNNPTGTTIKESDLTQILTKTPSSIVVLDEAYADFASETFISLISEFPNLLILRTFSKAYGLAGLRVGVIVANKDRIADLFHVTSPYSVSAIAVKALEIALDDRKFVNNYILNVQENRKILELGLQQLGFRIVPSEANFVLVKFGPLNNYIIRGLRERGILIRDRSSYQSLEGWSRITVGTTQQVNLVLDEIKVLLSEKTIIFDMDGVLVDVSQSYRSAIKDTVRYFTGISVDDDEINKMKQRLNSNNDWTVTSWLIAQEGIDIEMDEIIEKFQSFYLGKNYSGYINKERPLILPDYLYNLSVRYRMAVITGRPRQEAEFTLNSLGMINYFDMIVTMDDVPDKPDPTGIKLVLTTLRANEAIYIGDTVNDIQAANNAGITSIGVATNNNQEFLLNNGAKYVILSVKQLEDVL